MFARAITQSDINLILDSITCFRERQDAAVAPKSQALNFIADLAFAAWPFGVVMTTLSNADSERK